MVGGHALNHLQVTILAGTMQFIVGQWRDWSSLPAQCAYQPTHDG